jgi:hypothetical protein
MQLLIERLHHAEMLDVQGQGTNIRCVDTILKSCLLPSILIVFFVTIDESKFVTNTSILP